VFSTAFLVVRGLAVVDHIMKPARQLHGMQVLRMRAETLHSPDHLRHMMESMVEASRTSIALTYFLELLVGARWIDRPDTQKVAPGFTLWNGLIPLAAHDRLG